MFLNCISFSALSLQHHAKLCAIYLYQDKWVKNSSKKGI